MLSYGFPVPQTEVTKLKIQYQIYNRDNTFLSTFLNVFPIMPQRYGTAAPQRKTDAAETSRVRNIRGSLR